MEETKWKYPGRNMVQAYRRGWRMFTLIYRLMELIDGERGFKLISYRLAEKVKLYCLSYIY